jgi:hypothetical protein
VNLILFNRSDNDKYRWQCYVTWDRHKVLPDCGILERNTPLVNIILFNRSDNDKYRWQCYICDLGQAQSVARLWDNRNKHTVFMAYTKLVNWLLSKNMHILFFPFIINVITIYTWSYFCSLSQACITTIWMQCRIHLYALQAEL